MYYKLIFLIFPVFLFLCKFILKIYFLEEKIFICATPLTYIIIFTLSKQLYIPVELHLLNNIKEFKKIIIYNLNQVVNIETNNINITFSKVKDLIYPNLCITEFEHKIPLECINGICVYKKDLNKFVYKSMFFLSEIWLYIMLIYILYILLELILQV